MNKHKEVSRLKSGDFFMPLFLLYFETWYILYSTESFTKKELRWWVQATVACGMEMVCLKQ